MKVLLINPPFQRLKKISSRYFPLGLGYLAGVAHNLGFETFIYNAELPDENEETYDENVDNLLKNHFLLSEALNNLQHPVWLEVRNVLAIYKPDIIGISVMTAKLSSSIVISKICKELLPNTKIVWGGPHPTILPEKSLKFDSVDFLVRGEGEETFKNFLAAIKNSSSPNQIDGISYKNGMQVINNKLTPLINDLDHLALPERNLSVYPERYNGSEMGSIITSRGCPFHCGFCGAKNMWTKKVRARSNKSVINEILYLKEKYKLNNFYFWDDSFTVNRNRTISLCKELINSKLNIKWSCSTRVNIIDDELLKWMKKAGCVNIDIGIESGSDKMLKEIGKNITVNQIENALHMIRKNKINVNAYFMIGFPTETSENIEQTYNFLQNKKIGKVLFSIFTPYPGTELFEQADKLGLIPKNIDWSNFSHQSPENHFMKYVKKEEFNDWVIKFNNITKKHNSNLSTLWNVYKNRIFVFLANPFRYSKKIVNILKS